MHHAERGHYCASNVKLQRAVWTSPANLAVTSSRSKRRLKRTLFQNHRYTTLLARAALLRAGDSDDQRYRPLKLAHGGTRHLQYLTLALSTEMGPQHPLSETTFTALLNRLLGARMSVEQHLCKALYI